MSFFPSSQHYCTLGTAKALTCLYSVTTERLQSHQTFNRDATVDQTIASLLQIWELQQFSFIITYPSNWTSRAILSSIIPTSVWHLWWCYECIHGHLGKEAVEVDNSLKDFSKYLILFCTRNRNYILVLIYCYSCCKFPLCPPIQLSYPLSIQLWKKKKKLVIKTIISASTELFDLDFYKVCLVEIGQTGRHRRKRGK